MWQGTASAASFRGGAVFAVAWGLALAAGSPCWAIKPESPEVRKAVEKGLAFLAGAEEGRLGGKCLIAMAFLKNDAPPDHPKVVQAVQAVLQISKGDPEKIATSHLDLYSHGIAIVFLCEVDSSRYNGDIERLLRALELRQKKEGAWGYLSGGHADTCDTSMTQYAVLGTWAAVRHGVRPNQESIERVTNWLIRTQDPDGSWGYQGKDPGDYNRVKQDPLRQSLSAAGCGATFICSDLLGFTVPVEADDAAEGLPAAFRLVREEKKLAAAPLTKNVDARLLQRARSDGSRQIAGRDHEVQKGWATYYLYALERYYSFRELSDGKSPPEPDWYNVGAKFLLTSQQENGSWADECQPPASTSLAILFLCRGTKKTIEKTIKNLGEGVLVGGRGLPSNTSDVKLRNGSLVGKSETKSMQSVLAILEEGEDSAASSGDEVDDLALSADPRAREAELTRLRRLLQGGNFPARLLAVKALSRAPDLNNAPALIFALGDPDERIAREALAALKFLSRQLTGDDLPPGSTATQRAALKKQWEAWYLSIRPEGELLD